MSGKNILKYVCVSSWLDWDIKVRDELFFEASIYDFMGNLKKI